MLGSEGNWDAVVIGGGAAGLMCALEAGRRRRKVLLIEHNPTVGRKIRISGGGRCNFTNTEAGPDNYHSSNPRFCRSALARYTSEDFLAEVDASGIDWHEKKLGQLFCDDTAQQIIDMLLEQCSIARVVLWAGTRVDAVNPLSDAGGFEVETSNGTLKTAAVVVATGGLSFPKLGATDFGYRLARQFEHPMVPRRPGLVGLHIGRPESDWLGKLSGVSFEAIASCGGMDFRENVLVTHRGLSGPAVLQASSLMNEDNQTMCFNLLPDEDAGELLQTNRGVPLGRLLSRFLPSRFAEAWAANCALKKSLAQFTRAELDTTADALRAWSPTIVGDDGYARAEVTLGGVDTRQLSPQTMESRLVPGLYFIGEVVDVTGWLGGYNFQWAWASGAAAGRAL